MRLTRSPGRPLKSVLTQGGWSSGAMSCVAMHRTMQDSLLSVPCVPSRLMLCYHKTRAAVQCKPCKPCAPQCSPQHLHHH